MDIRTLEVMISEEAIFASLSIYVESTSFGSITRTAHAITWNTPAILPKRYPSNKMLTNWTHVTKKNVTD